jgi:hypothetical protein
MLNHECFSHTNYSIRLYFTNKAGRFPPKDKVKFLCSIQCFQSKCPRENVNFSISFQNQHYRFKKIKKFLFDRPIRWSQILTFLMRPGIKDLCQALLPSPPMELTKSKWPDTIEILDLECVLRYVTGVQIENKNALINRPCWIYPWSGLWRKVMGRV